MKRILLLIVMVGIVWTARLNADTTAVHPPTSGEIKSEMPAATTGTAPIDSNTPSGTGTTGTSGITMEEAAENNDDNSSLLYVGLAALLTIVIVMLVKKRKNPKV